MKLDLDALEQVARAATQGIWRKRSGCGWVDFEVGPICKASWSNNDAEHIAAFNPSVALEMIAELRRLAQIDDMELAKLTIEERMHEMAKRLGPEMTCTLRTLLDCPLADISSVSLTWFATFLCVALVGWVVS